MLEVWRQYHLPHTDNVCYLINCPVSRIFFLYTGVDTVYVGEIIKNVCVMSVHVKEYVIK